MIKLDQVGYRRIEQGKCPLCGRELEFIDHGYRDEAFGDDGELFDSWFKCDQCGIDCYITSRGYGGDVVDVDVDWLDDD